MFRVTEEAREMLLLLAILPSFQWKNAVIVVPGRFAPQGTKCHLPGGS